MRTAQYDRLAELAGKAILLVLFGVLATLKILAIKSQLASWNELQSADKYLDLATQVAALAFLCLLLILTLLRLTPKASAQGWEPRLSALFGTFLSVSLVAMPMADLGWTLRIMAVTLVFVGWVMSVYVLAWLGRSFSITAQARRLVTDGPYAVVRHPLYVCEEIAMIGMVLLCLSPVAVAIAVVQWLFQLCRMRNEERVLSACFPEYADYAESTPRIIPRLFCWGEKKWRPASNG